MMHNGVVGAAVAIVEHAISKFWDMCRLNIKDSEFGIQVSQTLSNVPEKWDLSHVLTLFYEGQISESFNETSLFTNNIQERIQDM